MVFSGYMPSSGIAGSCGKYMLSFVGDFQTTFQSGCTILQSHYQYIRDPVSQHSHQYLVLSLFLIIALLIGMELYLIRVLICISLLASGVELSLSILSFH